MANCLVTKLKEVVNNSNLPILGEYAMLEVTTEGLGVTLRVKNYDESDVELRCDENGRFSNGQKTITLHGEGTLVETLSSINTKTVIYIKNIEKLEILVNEESRSGTGVGWGYKDLSNLQYLSRIKKLGFRNGYSDINSFKDLTTLEWLKADKSNCGGELSSLAELTNLTSLGLLDTSVAGSVDDFAQAQIANGRTSGQLRVYGNNKITYPNNGESTIIPRNKYVIITYNSALPDGYSISTPLL